MLDIFRNCALILFVASIINLSVFGGFASAQPTNDDHKSDLEIVDPKARAGGPAFRSSFPPVRFNRYLYPKDASAWACAWAKLDIWIGSGGYAFLIMPMDENSKARVRSFTGQDGTIIYMGDPYCRIRVVIDRNGELSERNLVVDEGAQSSKYEKDELNRSMEKNYLYSNSKSNTDCAPAKIDFWFGGGGFSYIHTRSFDVGSRESLAKMNENGMDISLGKSSCAIKIRVDRGS